MCCAARAARCAARATRGGRRARGTRKPLPTLKQLREKLKELGLPSSGKKADLLEAGGGLGMEMGMYQMVVDTEM